MLFGNVLRWDRTEVSGKIFAASHCRLSQTVKEAIDKLNKAADSLKCISLRSEVNFLTS